MKILVLCDVLFPQTTGGSGRVARAVAERLAAAGNSIQFLTRETSVRPVPDTIRTTYYPPPTKASPSFFRRIFADTVRTFNPDIVHIHQPLPAILSIPSSFPLPCVYTFHSSWPEEFKAKASSWPGPMRRLAAPLLMKLEGVVVHRAAVVTVLSEFSRRKVLDLHGRASTIIPGGVDSRRFRPIEQIRTGRPQRLVTLRNLVPRMGLPQLIQAMKELPEDMELRIGGEGPMREELQRLIGELALAERIQLVGHVPDEELPAFYSRADWFVLPTRELEGFGLVILESLSCGTPVLGTRIGAIPELLERFNPGWVIEEPTAGAIAASVLWARTTTPPPPQELHHRIRTEFDWDKIAERYLELFANLA